MRKTDFNQIDLMQPDKSNQNKVKPTLTRIFHELIWTVLQGAGRNLCSGRLQPSRCRWRAEALRYITTASGLQHSRSVQGDSPGG